MHGTYVTLPVHAHHCSSISDYNCIDNFFSLAYRVSLWSAIHVLDNIQRKSEFLNRFLSSLKFVHACNSMYVA